MSTRDSNVTTRVQIISYSSVMIEEFVGQKNK